MTKFIAVGRTAAKEIISAHLLQSTEFEDGLSLSKLLSDPNLRLGQVASISVIRTEDGIFFASPEDQSNDYVVFDLDTCGLFGKQYSDEESLMFFQKVLRFVTKSWEGLRLSVTERPLANSSKIIIWPYPISLHTSFRITIETAPDKARQEKRAASGRCFLVYRSGIDDGLGPNEEASTTNFRKFLEARKGLTFPPKQNASLTPQVGSLSVTQLDGSQEHTIQPFQNYETWLALLTKKQKEFIESGLNTPHRIEGPAGTGKSISLILKAIHDVRMAANEQRDYHAIFITHSEATRRSVEQQFFVSDSSVLKSEQTLQKKQWIAIQTLQQLCSELLVREISDSEFIDRDAMESKQMQTLYVSDALSSVMDKEYHTYENIISPRFKEYIKTSDSVTMTEMVQHEISVVIKGRAGEKLENYRRLPHLPYGLPVETEQDRGFVWQIFQRYQSALQTTAQFDTDDIVLTTIGQLDTPIWRRRRAKEGYDGIYIDETHLFNVNELSMFHYLTRTQDMFPIAYSIDRSQAIGDHDWSDDLFESVLSCDKQNNGTTNKTRVDSVFRCSPEIVSLAFSVTSSGATLFTNFDNSLHSAISMFTADEERKCEVPVARMYATDDEMIEGAFARAESLPKEIGASRSNVAIIAFSLDLFSASERFCGQRHKAVEVIKQRGDVEAVLRAQKSGKLILSTPEYVGGLEFDAVVLLGVDGGRVPPTKVIDSADSTNFLTYAAHNRLYVSITRARYRVEICATSERGLSPLLSYAVSSNWLQLA